MRRVIACGALLAACLFLFFWRIGRVPLFDLDEALYVTCAKEMLVTGNFITPQINFRPPYNPAQTLVPFFEKPILAYWLCAASMKLYGSSEGAARLPSALVALLTVGLITVIGWRWRCPRAGLFAGICFAAAPMTIVDARQMTTDGLLVLCFAASLAGFWLAYATILRTDGGTWLHRAGWLLFWTSCALSILTKGAIGIVLPALVIAVFIAGGQWRLSCRLGAGATLSLEPQPTPAPGAIRVLRALRPLPGCLVLIVIAGPWHYLIWRAGGVDGLGFTWVQQYIIRQHIGRFQGLDKLHNEPMLSYLLFFALGFFPWSCFAFPALCRRLPRLDSGGSGAEPLERFLRVWFWTIFIFFSAGAAKLPTYIAPAYPAAALLTGAWLDRLLTLAPNAAAIRSLRKSVAVALLFSGIIAIATWIGPLFMRKGAPVPADVIHAVRFATTGMLILTAIAACIARCGRSRQAVLGTLSSLVIAIFVLISVAVTRGYAAARNDVLGPYQRMAVAAKADAASGVPIIYFHIVPRRPSMNYYGGYSPDERRDIPLLPYAHPFLDQSKVGVDIVTTDHNSTTYVAPEARAEGDTWRILAEDNGWLVGRLERPIHPRTSDANSRNPAR
ncbi:MAG: glycosyltransferase family 39 protein [Armatimonadetes bacterium]|nr:glycosyltransferase family 39 protein [Armatimonadota bacterium]MDE2206508.1 glycosyltransferase family 39 protein [Armatimonadota bacterium]